MQSSASEGGGMLHSKVVNKECIVMTYTPPFRVVLNYFNHTGKWYSEGEYQSKKLNLWEIWDEVKGMLAEGKRPGLVDGINEFYVVVEAPEHPHNHPFLIVPRYDEQQQ